MFFSSLARVRVSFPQQFFRKPAIKLPAIAHTKPRFFTTTPTTMTATDPSKYLLNHTMLRIKDPKASIPFYEKHFGMKVLGHYKFDMFKFDIYYLAYDHPESPYYGKPVWDRQGVLELTHNYGTETQADYKLNNGNVEPHRGFGHICFSVDNIEKVSSDLEQGGVKFQKKLSDGRQKDIAFALDPDGYWIELISNKEAKVVADETNPSSYRFNHTMLRIKDPKKSIEFYTEKLGMRLFRTSVHENAKFTLYFLSYDKDFKENDESRAGDREGLLELTHNWGTENDAEFSYHNGNAEPQGFGHLAITVDDIEAACERFNQVGVKFKKQLDEGGMKYIAFILDPDGYWIEVIPPYNLPLENHAKI